MIIYQKEEVLSFLLAIKSLISIKTFLIMPFKILRNVDKAQKVNLLI